MTTVEAPKDRNGFKVAIICALPIEAEMVELVLDKDWQDENKTYGKAPRDPNAYTTGVIGDHNVVLAYMPSIGSNHAASVASGLRSSFTEVSIVFVVGVCGVVPYHPQTNEEIVLGDCIISTTIVQYDFGTEYPLGFKRKHNIEDSLGRADLEIRSHISKLTTRRNRQNLATELFNHLELMQQEHDDLHRPESKRDRLYQASYQHRHQNPFQMCSKCLLESGICTKDCDSLGCNDKFVVERKRLQGEDPKSNRPRIHFGRFGTANTVMKSGEKRDKINAEDDITAFEMESCGIWDLLPTIIIKAAADYADSHKTKEWQPYSAATAAACLKAVLKRWDPPFQVESFSNSVANPSPKSHVPTLNAASSPRNSPSLPGKTFSLPPPTQDELDDMYDDLMKAIKVLSLDAVQKSHKMGASFVSNYYNKKAGKYQRPLNEAAERWFGYYELIRSLDEKLYLEKHRAWDRDRMEAMPVWYAESERKHVQHKETKSLKIIVYLMENGAQMEDVLSLKTRDALTRVLRSQFV